MISVSRANVCTISINESLFSHTSHQRFGRFELVLKFSGGDKAKWFGEGLLGGVHADPCSLRVILVFSVGAERTKHGARVRSLLT